MASPSRNAMFDVQAALHKMFRPRQMTKSRIRVHAFVLLLAMFGTTVYALISLVLPEEIEESPASSIPVLLAKTFTNELTVFKVIFAICSSLASSALSTIFLSEACISVFRNTDLSTSSTFRQFSTLIITTIIAPASLSVAFPLTMNLNSDYPVTETAGSSTRGAADLLVVATLSRETVALVTLHGTVFFEALVFSLIATLFPTIPSTPENTFRSVARWSSYTGNDEDVEETTVISGIHTILDIYHMKTKRLAFPKDHELLLSRFTIRLTEARTGYSKHIDLLEADFSLVDQNLRWNTLEGAVFVNRCIVKDRRDIFQKIPALLTIYVTPAMKTIPQFLDLHTRLSIPESETEIEYYHDRIAMERAIQRLNPDRITHMIHTTIHEVAERANQNVGANENRDDQVPVVQTPKVPFYQSDIVVTDKGYIFLRMLNMDSWINVPCDRHPFGHILIPTTPDLEIFLDSMDAKVEMVVYRTLGYVA